METQKLRYFAALAEHLHFTRAAEELHVSQPHLSREIRSIERTVGAPLLERSTRNVRLTRAGEVFYDGARRVLDDIERTMLLTRSVAEGLRGNLRVGFVGSVTYSWLPFLVDRFRLRYPDARVEIQSEMLTGWQVNALMSDRLDAGLLRGPVHHPDLRTELLATEPMIAVLPAGHPVARDGVEVTVKALRDQDFVAYSDSASSVTRRAALAACLSAGFEPRICQTVEDTHTLISLVAAGIGVALVPAAAANFTVSGVAYRNIIDVHTQHDLVLAWAGELGKDRPLLQNFVELATEYSTS